MKEIVISAYDRDYSWIDKLDRNVKVTVYRKGTNFHNPKEIFIDNNVGRDVHTFFYHFVKNYNNLSDYTFTSQDYFEDHVNNYIQLINGNVSLWNEHAIQISSGCWFFSTTYPLLISDKFGQPHHETMLDIEPIWDILFKSPCPDKLRFTSAGHYCITKEHVRKRPIGFYLDILRILEEDQMSPWIIERLLPYIFDVNYETKKNYNFDIKNNIESIPIKFDQFREDIFVVDCWLDTKEKEITLVNLIKKLKVYGIPILLCGHYPVPQYIIKMVDYYLYDKNNDILLQKDFEEYQVYSDRWTVMSNCKVINKVDFHHDYAIWETIRNAFRMVKNLGYKYIHFLEYDNLPEETQYRQAFIEYIRFCDAVVYEYMPGSTKEQIPYCSTYIYSIRTEIASQLVEQFYTKKEYFTNKPGGWQLENVFFQSLKKLTGNIVVTKYIPNNNEFNIYAAWNRNGILKNDARFQTYLVVDKNDKLYVHFISGFSEKPADKDYVVEVIYDDRVFFHTIYKGHYQVEDLGYYKRGKEVKVLYQGLEVFSEILSQDVETYRQKNNLILNYRQSNREINLFFIDGPFIEIKDTVNLDYKVKFINTKTNNIEYEVNLSSNQWARCSISYSVDWKVTIEGIGHEYYWEHIYNPTNKRILIGFESKSLGDNIAFIPYVEKYRKEKNCHVICSTFHNDLFREQYPEIEFVEPGTGVDNLYALFRLGFFYNNGEIDMSKHPSNPIKEPLMKVASDILGLEYEEIKTKVPNLKEHKNKKVCIAIHSTAQAKYWNNPNGWQKVVDYLSSLGYEVRLLSREENGYMGNWNPEGVIQQPPSTTLEILKTLQESEFFIGISSGLSWLAWAAGIPVVLISGFTDDYLEPKNGIHRVINKNVCNSCWHTHKFDPGDWNWCPVHKGTERQFECSKSILPEDVINQINNILM